MKIKSQLYRVLTIAILVIYSTCVGCKRNTPINTDNKPTSAVSTPVPTSELQNKPTSVEKIETTPSTAPTVTEVPSPSQADPTETADPDDDEDEEDPEDGSPEVIPSVGDEDDEDEENPEDVVVPTPQALEPEDILRAESWNGTFLIWVPEFTDGTYIETRAEDTEDIAVFDDVEEAKVREYIETLKAVDFVHHVETVDNSGGIAYEACNSDNWWVSVVYSNGGLSIGSGYRDEQTEETDRLEELWATTRIGLLPKFEEGTMTGKSSDSSSELYVLFEEVSEDYVRTYIQYIIEAGFDEDEDAGDSDGFIWYSAGNSDGLICDLTYYDGSVRLGISE